MKKMLVAACFAASLPLTAQADLLFTVGGSANYWNADPSGQLSDDVQLGKSGLNLDSTGANQLKVFVEHPIPVLPNLKIANTGVSVDGTGSLNTTIFNQPFNAGVKSTLDLSHTDFTLYWGLPLPIPFVDINFGLTARQFDGEAKIEGQGLASSQKANEAIDFVLPMGYLNVNVDTPFGVYGYADVNYVGYGDNKLSDTSFAVGYQLPVPIVDLGVEVGQRSLNLETEELDNSKIDVELSGLYYGLSLSVGL